MRFSASKRALLQACAFPFRDDAITPVDEPGQPALTGILLHSMNEAHLRGDPIPAGLEGADEKAAKAMFEAWVTWWSRWEHNALSWQTEVPLAIDLETGEGRILPTDGTHRDYSQARPSEATGTADVIALDPDGETVWVVDFKSTRTPWDTINARPQLTALALMICRALGRKRAICIALHISEKGCEPERFELDLLDLDVEFDDMAGRVWLAHTKAALPEKGPHCTSLYCPALAGCPAHLGAMVDFAGEEPANALALLQDGEAKLTAPQLARAHDQIEVVEARLKLVKERFREEVQRVTFVELANDRVVFMGEESRQTISMKGVREAYGDEGEAKLEELRVRGALKTSSFPKLKELKATPKLMKDLRAKHAQREPPPDDRPLDALLEDSINQAQAVGGSGR